MNTCAYGRCTSVLRDTAVDEGLAVGVLANTIVSSLVIPYFSGNLFRELQGKDDGYW